MKATILTQAEGPLSTHLGEDELSGGESLLELCGKRWPLLTCEGAAQVRAGHERHAACCRQAGNSVCV